MIRDLNFLVPFPGKQNNVAGSCLMNCQPNGSLAVGFYPVFHPCALQSREGIVKDRHRVFAAGVSRSQHAELVPLPRRFAHERALGAVTVAAAAEQGEDATILPGLAHKLSSQ